MLAIVIPYYKKTFFRETIESIARQTCKDFVLYVGDDASPDSPVDIMEEYKDEINIVYHRYDENLGGKDLVAQWERCIELTKGEEWIWLFSDDDRMESCCVEELYENVKRDGESELYRFTKCFEDTSNKTSWTSTYQNGRTSFVDFLYDGLDMTENHITMPEFVFSRNLYEKYGFYSLPLAWGTDKATYLEYAFRSGHVYNLSSRVFYRFSTINISSDESDSCAAVKKCAQERFANVFVRNLLIKTRKKYRDNDMSDLSDWYIYATIKRNENQAMSLMERLKIAIRLLPVASNKKDMKSIVKFII